MYLFRVGVYEARHPVGVWEGPWHRFLSRSLLVATASIPAFAVLAGHGLDHGITEALLVAFFLLTASWDWPRREMRWFLEGAGLAAASSTIEHLLASPALGWTLMLTSVLLVLRYRHWAPFAGLALLRLAGIAVQAGAEQWSPEPLDLVSPALQVALLVALATLLSLHQPRTTSE